MDIERFFLNLLFYLFIFLSSSAGSHFCWWSILAECASVFLWVKMQQARSLLLDKPSQVSQGPPTELSIKEEVERHTVRVSSSWIHFKKEMILIFFYFLIETLWNILSLIHAPLLVASILLLEVCWCNHCAAGVRSEVLLNKIQLSRREQ